VKLAGKIGRQAVGVLSTSDRAPGLRLDGADPEYGRHARTAVVRVQRDLLEDSAVGVWLLDQRLGRSSNTVVAADGRVRVSKAGQLLLSVIASRARDREGTGRSGYVADVRFNHVGRHWRLYLGNRYVGPQYQNETGYIDRTDFHEQAVDVGYEWRPAPASPLNRWLVYVWPYLDMRHSRVVSDGTPEVQYVDPAVKIQLQRNVSANCYPSFHREGFAGRTLRYTFGACDHTIEAFKHTTFSGSFQFGEGLHYDLDNPVVGRQTLVTEEITVKPHDALSVGLVYLKSRLTHGSAGIPLVDQQIVRGRTAWQWTRFHAARVIVDYDTASRELGASLLYSWTPGPNSAIYLGWNDLLLNAQDPGDGLRRTGWVRQRRTLFVKLSYDFQR
jgi:hypothetical protein